MSLSPSQPPVLAEGVLFRAMLESDLHAVLAIEEAAHLSPWNEAIFRDCLRVRYLCLVAQRGRDIMGFGVLTVAAGECHLLNLCVAPESQGQGLGRRLLRRLLDFARRREADTAYLEVRASNQLAIGLYESEGFSEVGLRKAYYPAPVKRAGKQTEEIREHPGSAPREDALIMACPL